MYIDIKDQLSVLSRINKFLCDVLRRISRFINVNVLRDRQSVPVVFNEFFYTRTEHRITFDTEIYLAVVAVLQCFFCGIESDDLDLAAVAVTDACFIKRSHRAESHVVVLTVEHVDVAVFF